MGTETKKPILTKDSFKSPEDRGLAVIERTFEVITPVFGGGVRIDSKRSHEKPIDEVTPIRSAAVRGQLRFWWRATHGARCNSLEEMKAREDEIWGAAGEETKTDRKPSAVLELRPPDQTPLITPVFVSQLLGGRARGIPYGTFPLQPAREQPRGTPPGRLSRVNGKWTLRVVVNASFEKEVEDAIKAWLCFGGIGGRCRRGFGALASRGTPSPQELFKSMAGGSLSGFPRLGTGANIRVHTKSFATADEALDFGLKLLKEFRQGEGTARTKRARDSRCPGRSFWPEPDSIRQKMNARLPRHKDVLDHMIVFPRAAFGLPIIFHFKDEGKHRNDRFREPIQTTLVPEGKERHASQLIIRPFKTGARYGVMSLVLAGEPSGVPGLTLKPNGSKEGFTVSGRLTADEAKQLRFFKENKLPEDPDILSAFLALFESEK